MNIGGFFDLIIINPILNILVVLSNLLFHNFGLAIIVLTLVVRFIMYPLTKKQLMATRSMSDIQPKLQEVQKKYANDKNKLNQETARIMKESNFNPLGCLWPMLIQLPIWIALYQSIIRVMAATPEDFLNLADRLYSWPILYQSLPVEASFLWFNLSVSDLFLAFIVGLLTYIQQRMTNPNKASGKAPVGQAAQQGRMMLFMMPMMFVFFSMMFPSGLALYWATGSIFTIVMQYFTNKRNFGAFGDDAKNIWLRVRGFFKKSEKPVADATLVRTDKKRDLQSQHASSTAEVVSADKKENAHETSGNKRSDGGASHRTSSAKTKSSKRSGRSKRYR